MAGEDVVQEARALGWVPQEEFRGDVARWVDAETFLERGHTVMPILKKQNQVLEGQVQELRAETKRLQELFAASQESISALQKFHAENTKAQVERAKAKLLGELRQAKTDGDVDAEVQITDQLTEVNAALKEANKKPTATVAPEANPQGQLDLDPAFVKWAEQNTWFGKDVRKTNLAMGIANTLRADPENDTLTGVAFYNKINEEIRIRESGQQHDKVSGGSNSGSGGGGSKGKVGYADLDAEAKRICDSDAKKFAGEGKMFKTVADYRQWYAEQVLGE